MFSLCVGRCRGAGGSAANRVQADSSGAGGGDAVTAATGGGDAGTARAAGLHSHALTAGQHPDPLELGVAVVAVGSNAAYAHHEVIRTKRELRASRHPS